MVSRNSSDSRSISSATDFHRGRCSPRRSASAATGRSPARRPGPSAHRAARPARGCVDGLAARSPARHAAARRAPTQACPGRLPALTTARRAARDGDLPATAASTASGRTSPRSTRISPIRAEFVRRATARSPAPCRRARTGTPARSPRAAGRRSMTSQRQAAVGIDLLERRHAVGHGHRGRAERAQLVQQQQRIGAGRHGVAGQAETDPPGNGVGRWLPAGSAGPSTSASDRRGWPRPPPSAVSGCSISSRIWSLAASATAISSRLGVTCPCAPDRTRSRHDG